MIVCHCHVVNDRTVRAAVANGAADIDDVARACGAGTDCGGCEDAIDSLIHECRVRILVHTAS